MKLYYREWHFPEEPAVEVKLSDYRTGVHQRFTSPRTRKVVLAVYELGLEERVTVVPAKQSINNEEPHENPLGQEPTLITDDGLAIYDSAVICEYLDSLAPEPRLVPRAGEARWKALRHQALAEGLCAALVWCNNERRRAPEHQERAVFGRYEPKLQRGLDYLDAEAERWSEVTVGHLATVGLLGWADCLTWVKDFPWRTGRPRLASWYQRFSARPSMQRIKSSLEPLPDLERYAVEASPFSQSR